MFKEFKAFILRGNVLDLAVGLVVGAAFSKIVSSFVADILLPPVGMLIGKLDFSNLFLDLSHGSYASLAEAKKAGAPTINYGLFLNNVVDFLIVAAAIFMVVKLANRFTPAKPVPVTVTTRPCSFCLMEIPPSAKKCGHCTSVF
jgi:large conductance mechanosensitive channel